MAIKSGTLVITGKKKYLVKEIIKNRKEAYVLLEFEGRDVKVFVGETINLSTEFEVRLTDTETWS